MACPFPRSTAAAEIPATMLGKMPEAAAAAVAEIPAKMLGNICPAEAATQENERMRLRTPWLAEVQWASAVWRIALPDSTKLKTTAKNGIETATKKV